MVKDHLPHPAELQFKHKDRENLPSTGPVSCRAVAFFDAVNAVWDYHQVSKDPSLFHGVSDVIVSLWELWDDRFFVFEQTWPLASARLKELNSMVPEDKGFSEHYEGLFHHHGFPMKLIEGMLKRLSHRLRLNQHSVVLGIPHDNHVIFEEWPEDLFINSRNDAWRQNALLWKYVY